MADDFADQVATNDGRDGRIRLSICIPTRNRKSFIGKTIESIVSQPGFDNLCELVISDNASTDDTGSLVMEWASRHPRIRYLRNEKDLGMDENFRRVASAAQGDYIHLLGDKVCYAEGGLEKLLRLIGDGSCSALCLLNGQPRFSVDYIAECVGLDDFIRQVSFRVTWLSGIVLMRSEYEKLRYPLRASGSCLIHVDWILEVVAAGNTCKIVNTVLLREQFIRSQGGYNIFQVFIDNYLGLYEPFAKGGLIRASTLKIERRRLLLGFVFIWFIKTVILRSQEYDTSGAMRIIFKRYGSSPWLYLFPLYFLLWCLRQLKNRLSMLKRLVAVGRFPACGRK